MKKHFILLLICCLFLGMTPALFGAKHKTKSQKPKKSSTLSKQMFNSKGPIHIVSNRLDANNKKRIIIFSGHVVVKRSTLTLTCDRLTVQYTPKGGDISQILAEGSVVMKQPPRSATCQKAVFYQKTNKVVLMGNPILSEGKNKVTGSKVTFFLNSDKTIIEGGKKGRVSTTIVPKSQMVPFKAKP
jgi:lipopolysaccharide export system protein LptA